MQSYVIHLWEKPVNVLPMGNPATHYFFFLLINRHADPILANANLIFPRESSHLFKIAEIERVLTYEIIKDDLLCLRLNILRRFGELLQKTFFVFNFPHLVSTTHKSV